MSAISRGWESRDLIVPKGAMIKEIKLTRGAEIVFKLVKNIHYDNKFIKNNRVRLIVDYDVEVK